MTLSRLILVALLLAIVAPTTGAAEARTLAVVPIPGDAIAPGAAAETPIAVDDHGRVAFAAPRSLRHVVGVLAPGREPVSAVVPGLDAAAAIAFTRTGEIVGAGTSATHEQAPSQDPHGGGLCCDRPFVFRGRPGAVPTGALVEPDHHENAEILQVGVAGDGALALLVGHAADGSGDDGNVRLARVPAHGATAWRTLPSDDGDVFPYDLWTDPHGSRMVAVGFDGLRLRQAVAGPKGWRITDRPERLPGAGDQRLRLDPHGRIVTVFRHDERLWLRRGGGRRRVLGPISPGFVTDAGQPDPWAMAMGADGTTAIAWAHGTAIFLRTVTPEGRLAPVRRLGQAERRGDEIQLLLAVDGRGDAHTMFSSPNGTVTVWGPAGRRVISHGATVLRTAGLAVSPRGAEAAQVVADNQRLVAVRTP